jgi:hypothetical protein
LFWYMLERLVRIPTFMFMTLHELLISKVMRDQLHRKKRSDKLAYMKNS